ncbi:MAG: helix-turn-helix domain-containing protein [Treponema sp.]|nr:helix-turn-helix domain-containing protein [Treponema sp.]
MDMVKIGKFIAKCRKEKNLTQAQLAEKFGITDRAVSKWETGNSLPDASIMLQLCELLSINVNELLKGEGIAMENMKKESEANIIALKTENELQTKKLLKLEWLMIGIALAAFLLFCTAGLIVEKLFGTKWLCTALTLAGVFVLLCAAFVGIWIEQTAGYYECAACSHRYKPTYAAVLMAPHMGRTRWMKCPECKKRTWQKKVTIK